MGQLEGKTGVVFGVANKRSIAWACARAMHAEGMKIAVVHGDKRVGDTVRSLAEELPGTTVHYCDVTAPDTVDAAFASFERDLGGLDALVHGVAFARREDLALGFHEVDWEGYRTAQEISSYSLVLLSRKAVPLMEGRDASIVTLSYLGAERVIPGYHVMGVAKAALEAGVRYLAADLGPRGIRVNAISAGPIRTISSAVIPGMKEVFEHIADRSPLRRNISAEEVGEVCAFLSSSASRAITGTTIHVDAGFHTLGA